MVCVIYEPNLKEGLYGKGGHDNPLQYSCLENPMDGGAWWATVHRVTKSWIQLKRLSMLAWNHCLTGWGFLFLCFENQKRQWVEWADSLVSRNKIQRRERSPLRQHSKY